MTAVAQAGSAAGGPDGGPGDGAAPTRGALRRPIPVVVVAVALAVVAFTRYPLGAEALTAALLAAVLVALAATDLDRRVVPTAVVLLAIALTLIGHVVAHPQSSLSFALAGAVAGAVALLPRVARRSWMGIGDVKLIALLGAGLGTGVAGAVAIAFLSLFPFAVLTLVRGGLAARKTELPFGPSLAFGGLVILLGFPFHG